MTDTGPPTQRSVVVQLWRGPLTVATLKPGDPNPTPEDLDQIAGEYAIWSTGVLPTVRVLEAVTMAAAQPQAPSEPRGTLIR